MHILRRLILATLLSLQVPLALAQAALPQRFALPGHGQLQLTVPASWHAEVHEGAQPLPPTITFTSSAGAPCEMLVTPIWPMGDMKALPDANGLREQVASAARGVAPQAVEQSLPLHELGGGAAHGYYFAATDKAPKPGEFKYLTQGIVNLGDIELTFTVLTNDGQETVVRSALDMLRSASHVTTR
jgi:hypothetical protein